MNPAALCRHSLNTKIRLAVKTTYPISLTLIFAASLLASCEASSESQSNVQPKHGYDLCNRGISRTTEGVLRFCDQINEVSVDALKKKITPTDRQIIITSGGGSPSAAMELGRVILEGEIGLRVRQFCLSACATYVLPAAENIIIDDYTIVAFHHTSAFVVDTFADVARAPSDHPSRAASMAERAYFKALGLDDIKLDEIALAVEPFCLGHTTGDGQRIGFIRYRYDWSVPTPRQFHDLVPGGVRGYWPQSAHEVESILGATLNDESTTVRFGWPVQSVSSLDEVRMSLPTCVHE